METDIVASNGNLAYLAVGWRKDTRPSQNPWNITCGYAPSLGKDKSEQRYRVY